MKSTFLNSKTSSEARNIPRSQGFMQVVIIAIVIIAGLAYFNVDLHAVAQMPIVKQILTILMGAWDNFIFPMLKYLRESIFDLIGSASSTATSTATTTTPVLGN